MPTPDKQILVCLNQRPPENPRGSCAAKGAEELFSRLKTLVAERGLSRRMMVTRTGCLKHCSRGVTLAVHPDNVWYAGVTLADLDEIIESHLLGGVPVERLRMPDIPWE